MTIYDISNASEANEHPDGNRQFAERVLTRIDRMQAFTSEQVASFSKWLTASLLAVNGAGGLASLNLLQRSSDAWLAAMMFGLGIVLALCSGTILQEIYNRATPPLLDQDNYWATVSIDGVRDGDLEAQLEEQSRKPLRFSWAPPLLGWLSGFSFIAGAVAMAVAATPDNSARSSACLRIEQDMLSVAPKRANGAEIYSALGCKPRGID
jgi:hypothetical protein